MNSIDRRIRRCRSRTRLSTVPWIETSRAEVISSAMITSGAAGQRPGQRDPLPLPAGELLGVAIGPVRGEVDQLEQAGDLGPPGGSTVDGVPGEGLRDRGADRHARVQGRVRVLEDHLQRAPAGAGRGAAAARRAGSGRRSSGVSPTAARASVDLPGARLADQTDDRAGPGPSGRRRRPRSARGGGRRSGR